MSKYFQDLTSDIKKLVQITFKNPSKVKKSTKNLGCKHCPLNKDENVRQKIKGLKRIKRRKIMVWCQNPGNRENEEGLELVGPAGRWLWDELAKVNIERKDVDVQNVVRCATLEADEDTGYLKDRTPTKEEIKCCSIYNTEALELNGGKVKLHLVFGQVAAASLLGKEYKKDNPIFFSEKLKAKVICLDHPSYFLHGAPHARLEQFRDRLKVGIDTLKSSDRFAVLKKHNYACLTTPEEVKEYLIYAKEFLIRKKRAAVIDVESGWIYKDYSSDKLREKQIDSDTKHAKQVMLMVGICHAPGTARSILLHHPDNTHSEKTISKVQELINEFIADKDIEKVLHYGSSDFESTEELLGTKIRNYWFDTNYSCYLKWPQLRKFGLDALSKEFLPEFYGYKDIIKPYLVPSKHNFATIPIKILTRYNCGDCDVTKRLEILTRKTLLDRDKNSKPLLKVYRNTAFTLRDMQARGPFYDKIYARHLTVKLETRIKRKLKKLRRYADNKNFNPGSPLQVKKVLYKKLKLPILTVKKVTGSTSENTLKVLQAQTKHPFIEHLLDYRGWKVMKNTQLSGYEASAKFWGRLRTIWWLTGAITGRLRSGGKEEKNCINLQNVPKDPVIKNILVSDINWRKIKKYYKHKLVKKLLKMKVLMVADYSGIELRVIAIMGEPKFIPMFQPGKDVHAEMGSNFTDWSYEQIHDTQKYGDEIRTKVKNINFGLPFGMGKQSFYEGLIARGTKISRRKSDKLFDDYFKEYNGVDNFQDAAAQEALDTGHAKTLFGFWRPIITEGEGDRSTFWKNQAVNSKVQGTAHQFLLIAMAVLWISKKVFNYLSEASMEIHDALAFFSYVRDMKKTHDQLKNLLEKAVPEYIKKHFKYKLTVPLECEIKAGFRMGVMVKYNGEEPMEFIEKWLARNEEINAKVYSEWKVAE
jgi:uracil-DNA glycosylase family 4